MSNRIFYVPILPCTLSSDAGGAVERAPYHTPEFWPMVNTLREAIYRMTSQNPEQHDLPGHGVNRNLDQKVKAFIERKWGIKRASLR